MRPLIELLLISLLITTSAVANEVDRATPPDITHYCATELSADSGLEYLQTVDLNRRGQVLGWGYLGLGVEVFLWDRKHGYEFIDELAHEQEITTGAVAGFNDRGQIVATRSIDPDGAFLRAVIWRRGKGLQFLEPAPGDDSSVAVDINNRGEAVGISGPYPDESAVGERSVIWDRHGRVTVIPAFPDSESGRPYAMNDAEQVIGANGTPSGVRGYIWDRKSGLRTIEGLISGRYGVPSSINDRGEVVGSSSFFYNGNSGAHAIFWSEETGTVDLGDLPGDIENSHASDINNHRQIVGYATGQSGAAVIWDSEGQIHNLNELLVRDEPDDQYLYMTSAREITDAGWITASGYDTRDHQFRSFVLTPARRSPRGSYDCSRK